jgi:histidinol-phosphate aminotransferase
MLNAKRPAKEMIEAMASQRVHIGRSWPIWPTCVRITIGTRPEMEEFQTALHKVMSGAVSAGWKQSPQRRKSRRLDGIISV